MYFIEDNTDYNICFPWDLISIMYFQVSWISPT
nr:MAG TPA_asm: hypothetical protein [Caudoviricetes sp.]